MRADMKKVLTERPRRGGVYTYNDIRRRENAGDYDDLPSHQGMRRPYGWNTKEFTDLIGPLRGYLRGCAGRRWDDVWSEICQVVGSGNTVDQHLRGHVMQEVETLTVLVDGKVYARRRYSGWYEPDVYVHPIDGLIYVNDNRPRKAQEKRRRVDGLSYRVGADGLLYPVSLYRSIEARFVLKLIGDRKAMLIDGIWYWIEMANTPPAYDQQYVQDGVTKTRRVYSARLDFVTGEFVNEGRYHADKRQMASRDLRRHGLCNIR